MLDWNINIKKIIFIFTVNPRRVKLKKISFKKSLINSIKRDFSILSKENTNISKISSSSRKKTKFEQRENTKLGLFSHFLNSFWFDG